MSGHEWRYVQSKRMHPGNEWCSGAMHDLWECAQCGGQEWVEEWSDDWGLVGPGGSWVDYVGPKTKAPDTPNDGSCEAKVTSSVMES